MFDMNDYYNKDLPKLVGEKLVSVDIFGFDEILLTTESGKKFKMYHSQDCCERVSLIDDCGKNLKNLVGRTIVGVNVEYYKPDQIEANKYCDYADSSTITQYRFVVDGATEIVRWFGNSNGYYSENASLEEIL